MVVLFGWLMSCCGTLFSDLVGGSEHLRSFSALRSDSLNVGLSEGPAVLDWQQRLFVMTLCSATTQ